jgi:superfamily II DNA/RNA helicase
VTREELESLAEDPLLLADYRKVTLLLAGLRVGIASELDNQEIDRLFGFVELVLSHAAEVRELGESAVAMMAGNAALALATQVEDSARKARLRLRAGLLFDLAGRPMMSAAVVKGLEAPRIVSEYFRRSGVFASLGDDLDSEAAHNGVVDGSPLLAGLGQEAWDLARFQHGFADTVVDTARGALLTAALHYGLDLNASDVAAFSEATITRAANSTRSHVPDDLLGDLAAGGFPPELWSGQALALEHGLLDETFDAWSFSSPTGTGKTFLARLLILATLRAQPGRKVLYVVPSRALVRQVTSDLSKMLDQLGIEVVSVTPQLVALDDDEDEALREADVLVLTPEKADLLLRIDASTLDDVALVVIDEAHHIESGTRGVLLELYLWRLKKLAGSHARFVFMSAVAPNVDELAKWAGDKPGGLTVNARATGMRVGVYGFRSAPKRVEGWINYTDGTELRVVDTGADRTQKRGIAQLARVLGESGPVLVVARGKGTAESLAQEFVRQLGKDAESRLSDDELKSSSIERLDSRLEREMYAAVPLRAMLEAGVAYHHAGLPPRVREAVEAAITDRKVKFVFATTTLAEGVNFPFSSVIVQSLAVREPPTAGPASYRLITPRTFWNIAGRAGRAGFDYEGQVILYGPSLDLDKVKAVTATLDPYLESDPSKIAPVESALATGVRALRARVEAGAISNDQLDEVELSADLPTATRGFVNLVRVGIAHARASGLEASATNLFDGTLAAQALRDDDATRAFARALVERQALVVDRYLSEDGAPSEKLLAELGLSMDTLSRLQEYIRTLPDWQFDKVLEGIPGGHLRAGSLKYFFSAVMARMAEPEGSRLGGGFMADLVIEWTRGIPFAGFTARINRGRLEDLINVLYSRIQYMLPWALYAIDRFMFEECTRRGKPYDGQVHYMAYLVDAGVPNFGALRLTHAGFERADATRLARAHQRDREARATTDVLGWVAAQKDATLFGIVRGADNRRIDYDLIATVKKLRGASEP